MARSTVDSCKASGRMQSIIVICGFYPQSSCPLCLCGEFLSCGRDRHARDDALHSFYGRPLRVDVVGYGFAATQYADSIDHLKHVVDVVCDQDAGMPGGAGATDESEYSLGFFDPEVVGRF